MDLPGIQVLHPEIDWVDSFGQHLCWLVSYKFLVPEEHVTLFQSGVGDIMSMLQLFGQIKNDLGVWKSFKLIMLGRPLG